MGIKPLNFAGRGNHRFQQRSIKPCSSAHTVRLPKPRNQFRHNFSSAYSMSQGSGRLKIPRKGPRGFVTPVFPHCKLHGLNASFEINSVRGLLRRWRSNRSSILPESSLHDLIHMVVSEIKGIPSWGPCYKGILLFRGGGGGLC